MDAGVFQVLDETMKLLNSGRACLAFPKKKSVEDLITCTTMVREQTKYLQ